MSMALKQVFNKDRTFRPKRKFEPGTQRFELHKKAQASLNAGLDLKQAVQLPHGEDLNDWVAVHVVDFFNRINLIYGTINDSCTDQTCPIMSGGPKYEYRWQDEQKYKKPTALPAPKYMSLLMDWIEVQINNEHIFPTNVGTPFPKTFMQVAKKILSRLFRVFVHVYIHHFDRVSQMGAEAHVNTYHKELEPLVSICVKENNSQKAHFFFIIFILYYIISALNCFRNFICRKCYRKKNIIILHHIILYIFICNKLLQENILSAVKCYRKTFIISYYLILYACVCVGL
ncbi:hypothetical protein PO909_018492 [Leuciscus waleckii]